MKLYLLTATAAASPTTGDQSSANAKYTLGANNASAAEQSLALDTAIGGASAGTTHSFNSDATTATRTNFMGRWSTIGLSAQTFGSGTWTIGFGLNESNTNADSLVSISIYVWRPGTSSVVGYVYDSSTDLSTEWATASSSAGRVFTVSGSNVTSQLDDILVVEVFRNTDATGQAMATAYAQIIQFGGSTEPTNGGAAVANDTASYIDSPATINFSSPAVVVKQLGLLGVG
jgi:hypothetical protein